MASLPQSKRPPDQSARFDPAPRAPKDAKAIVHNLGWQICEKAVRLILGIAVGAIVARHLGPGSFGVLSYCTATLALFAFVVPVGTDTLLKRDLVRDPAAVGRMLSTVLAVRLIVAGMMVLLLLSTSPFLAHNAVEWRMLVIIAGSMVLPAFLVFEVHLHARMEMRAAAVIQMTGATTAAVARIVMVLLDAPLEWFAACLLVEAGVVSGCLIFVTKRLRIPWEWMQFDRVYAKTILVAAWPLLISGFAITLHLRIDQVMLRMVSGEAVVGVYAAAVRISEAAYFAPLVLAASVFPSLVAASDSDRGAFARRSQALLDLSVLSGMGWALLLTLAGGAMVSLLFGPAFAGASQVLTIHAWSAVFVFVAHGRNQLLAIAGITWMQPIAAVLGALVNIGANLVLIPRHGAIGAALATLLAQIVTAWLVAFLWRETRPLAWQVSTALAAPIRLCLGRVRIRATDWSGA